MTINQLCQMAYEVAKEKGFYDGRIRQALEYHMLFVSEVAEATEEVRKGVPPIYQLQVSLDLNGPDLVPVTPGQPGKTWIESGKPEGEAIELCDVIIRIADYFAYKGWDMEKLLKMKIEYNKTRSYRNGGKKL